MMWIVTIGILFAAVMIFVSTITINPGLDRNEDEAWVKVKIKHNSNVIASWCRIKPGRGIRFYTIDGNIINHNKERISVIEPCIESSTNHPIPEEINDFINGQVSDSWIRKSYPFGK